MDTSRFRTPEEAAVADYSSASRPRVIRSTMQGDTAWVIIDTEPSHPMEVVCLRDEDGLWHFGGDSYAGPEALNPKSIDPAKQALVEEVRTQMREKLERIARGEDPHQGGAFFEVENRP